MDFCEKAMTLREERDRSLEKTSLARLDRARERRECFAQVLQPQLQAERKRNLLEKRIPLSLHRILFSQKEARMRGRFRKSASTKIGRSTLLI